MTPQQELHHLSNLVEELLAREASRPTQREKWRDWLLQIAAGVSIASLVGIGAATVELWSAVSENTKRLDEHEKVHHITTDQLHKMQQAIMDTVKQDYLPIWLRTRLDEVAAGLNQTSSQLREISDRVTRIEERISK